MPTELYTGDQHDPWKRVSLFDNRDTDSVYGALLLSLSVKEFRKSAFGKVGGKGRVAAFSCT